MDIIAPPARPDSEARPETIARLQHLLAEAILAREWALNRVLELEDLPLDKHWFVPDEQGYCQACGLLQRNSRHAKRAA